MPAVDEKANALALPRTRVVSVTVTPHALNVSDCGFESHAAY